MEGCELKRQERLLDLGANPIAVERRRLGSSLWLLLLLIQWAGSAAPDVRPGDSIRADELARILGIGERQVRRELQRLRQAGYLDLRNTGRGFRIRIRKGRPV